MAKSAALTAWRPSLPEMPTPTCASCIMPTSFAPSPMANVIGAARGRAHERDEQPRRAHAARRAREARDAQQLVLGAASPRISVSVPPSITSAARSVALASARPPTQRATRGRRRRRRRGSTRPPRRARSSSRAKAPCSRAGRGGACSSVDSSPTAPRRRPLRAPARPLSSSSSPSSGGAPPSARPPRRAPHARAAAPRARGRAAARALAAALVVRAHGTCSRRAGGTRARC